MNNNSEVDLLFYEKKALSFGKKYICGIDEVGRGALAGPVVAAAVILDLDNIPSGIYDSKKISKKKRERLYEEIILSSISYSIWIIDIDIIDKVNIYNATKLAMTASLNKLSIKPDLLLIDAMKLQSGIEEISIIKGDTLSYSIAAASIIAKVSRDNIMNEYAMKYKEYGFEKHKGYGVKYHLCAIEKHGITDIHRKTFAPVYKYLHCEKNLFE